MRLYLILTLPISAVKVALMQMRQVQDKNILHDGKRLSLTGKKQVVFGDTQKFKEIKDCSRQHKCTINDLITAATSAALAKYFRENNDTTTHLNLAIPANIRW